MPRCLQVEEESARQFLTEPAEEQRLPADEEAYGQSRRDWTSALLHGGLGHPLSGELAGTARIRAYCSSHQSWCLGTSEVAAWQAWH